MDELNKIKKAHRNGESINKIANQYGRSWDTVKRIVTTPLVGLESRGQRPNKQRTVITPEVEEAITAYLNQEEQMKVHKKQRYTAAVIFKELKEKGIYKGKIRQIQDAVKRLREQRGQLKQKSYLPLEFPLGTTGQFDHGECDLIIGKERVKGYLFVCSVPGTPLRYCQVFPAKSSESWGEFHERSYLFFGGVFSIGIYDNDSVLVNKIIGNERKQTRFSHALEEHYDINSRFCNPAAGNEKGSVENGVGYCRRNYLPGCPSFTDWQMANEMLQSSCLKTIETEQHYQTGQPLKDLFKEVANKLNPLFVKHTWRRWEEVRVDSYQLVHVASQSYSVPERYVGSSVCVGLGAFDIQVFCDHVLIAEHSRRFGESGSSLCLNHYLDQLMRKPGALWDCQAVQKHQFAPELLQLWERLKERYPLREANSKFIKILCLGRRYGTNQLISASRDALSLGMIEPDAIESLLHSIGVASLERDKEILKDRIQHIQFNEWSCDIDQYTNLGGI